MCCGLSPGYRISWEEYNRTNTRVTHYLPNVTLEYRVTGLTALTTYTIEVAAMTAKGQGQVSASTISSGVPPGGCPPPAPSSCCSPPDGGRLRPAQPAPPWGLWSLGPPRAGLALMMARLGGLCYFFVWLSGEPRPRRPPPFSPPPLAATPPHNAHTRLCIAQWDL